MTQITVTLEKGADANFIRRMFENVKGVLHTRVTTEQERPGITSDLQVSGFKTPKDKEEWLKTLDQLYNSVDRSAVDIEDEKTRYILSR